MSLLYEVVAALVVETELVLCMTWNKQQKLRAELLGFTGWRMNG
jgi:hypothetical protein